MAAKSHFTFKKQQQNGILLLLAIICVFLFIKYLTLQSAGEEELDLSSEEIINIQQGLDSLKLRSVAERKPFNPNYITDYSGVALGMSTEEIDRLLHYRAQNKWINSVAEFQEITLVPDSILNRISPYFKFPDWVKESAEKKSAQRSQTVVRAKSYEEKRDLNHATPEEFQEIRGIGEVLSNRIVEYRKRIDGFSVDHQLHQVFGLDTVVASRILAEFTVKTPKVIQKIQVNTASASDIATIPGISFDLAKKIWEYRKLREQLKTWDEFLNIEGISPRKLELIQLYLSLD